MFRLTAGVYTLLIADRLPLQDDAYRISAALIEQWESDERKGRSDFLYLAVFRGASHAPFLIVTQHYAPGSAAAFYPGALLVEETALLFVGAGERLLAYRLDTPTRLWEDSADMGFWRWQRYRDVVIMEAELELAAWNIQGEKLWTTFVEPPWSYSLAEDILHLDVMGVQTSFPLHQGPAGPSQRR